MTSALKQGCNVGCNKNRENSRETRGSNKLRVFRAATPFLCVRQITDLNRITCSFHPVNCRQQSFHLL
jgi:hypothetical protein